MRKNRKAVAEFLFCLGVLEGRAFQLFGRISEKVVLPRARFSLLYVAYDSLKNYVILGELSKSFALPEAKPEDYERILGGVWKMVRTLSTDILKLEEITKEDLLSLGDRLIGIYAFMIVQLKTLRFMSKEISKAYNVDLEVLEGILDLVIEDEQSDTQVLMALKELSAGEPTAIANAPPVTRYTNPDRWYELTVGPY